MSHMQMQQGLAGTQMLGIRALPSLLHVAAAQQHALAAATAAVHHQQQYQQPWQQQCLRSRCVCAAAALAEPLLEQQAADPYKPFFSSRAKIAEACVPWLKQSRTRSNLHKNFAFEELYEGDLSSVLIATCRANSEKVVVKAFKRDALERRLDLQQKVKQEWEVHASLSHPNIISAYLGMEDATGVKLFMEYAGDSDAYSYINAKQRLCLREDDARQLVADVLTALQYMHSQGIVHRDIKSENVFRTASGVWKLGDFGSSLRVGDERLLARQVLKLEGTFSFAAPEYISIWSAFTKAQLTAATSFKLDSWSVGALAYDVLCGRAPFAEREDISRDDEKYAILNKEPSYPGGLSYEAVSFMMQALEKNRQKRPSIAQLQAHPWFDGLAKQQQQQVPQ